MPTNYPYELKSRFIIINAVAIIDGSIESSIERDTCKGWTSKDTSDRGGRHLLMYTPFHGRNSAYGSFWGEAR